MLRGWHRLWFCNSAMCPANVPTATYRLQFNAAFTFDAAAVIVDYLDSLATSTHDTKRSDDVRARINALSELSLEWKQAGGGPA